LFADPLVCRKYKKRFNSEILCAALWGVNLLIGTENGLMLLDRSGQGETFYLLPASRLLLHGPGMPTGDNCLSFILFFNKKMIQRFETARTKKLYISISLYKKFYSREKL
jgi:hypothetical protein